jgi:NADH-quinone oxidoreductase subunit N
MPIHLVLFPILTPLLILASGALLVLGAEAFLDRAMKHTWLPWLGVAGVLASGLAQALCRGTAFDQLGGILAMDSARMWLCEAILGSTVIAIAGLQQTLSRDAYAGGEPYALVMFSAIGAMVMVMATDLLTLFIGIEMASLSIYALVGLRRHRLESNEALFKYFVMGSVFSAVLLYGVALTYGATGFTQLGHAPLPGREGLLRLGQMLVMIGLLFKVGAVPFHFWAPDAYTGAPAAVTGFMGSVIKVGGFAALGSIWMHLVAVSSGLASGPLALDSAVRITGTAVGELQDFQRIFLLLGLLSVVLGNFAALKQTSSRRMIAYSSVAHAGYMLLAFALPVAGSQLVMGSLWFYLVGYALTTAGALTAIAMMAGPEDANDTLGGLAGQGRAMPLQGLVLTIFMASFAGVPPTMGFLGKYLVFQDLVARGWYPVAIAAMLMAVVGAAYYLRLIVAIWATSAKEPARTGSHALSSAAVGLGALATIVLILWPGGVFPAQPELVAAGSVNGAGAASAAAPVAAPGSDSGQAAAPATP